MRIQEWQALVGRDRDAGWCALRSALVAASEFICVSAGLSGADAEDIAHDGLARLAADGFAALQDVDPRVALSSWVRGVAQNLARRRLRERRQLLVNRGRGAHACGGGGANRDGWEGLDLGSITSKGAAAIRERLDGMSDRQAAKRLGVSRSTFRDRVARAVRQLRRAHGGTRTLPEGSRRWADMLLHGNPPWLRARDRDCLRFYAQGARRGEIAQRLNATVNAVHSLLGRLKRRSRVI